MNKDSRPDQERPQEKIGKRTSEKGGDEAIMTRRKAKQTPSNQTRYLAYDSESKEKVIINGPTNVKSNDELKEVERGGSLKLVINCIRRTKPWKFQTSSG
jgi:hypothetical protein